MQIVNESGNQPLLTIAIPTYNRASYLDLCLKRITEEIASLSKNYRCLVNVYVSDNASSDNTVEITSKYQSLNLYGLKVFRNTENIGADKNIAQCYDSAISPYVWVLGDDDVILTGGLKKVLDVLIKNEVDVLYVGNYGFNLDYSEKPIYLEKHGVSRFLAPLEFVRRTNISLTFISALIVRSGVGLEFRNGLLASHLVQFSWVLSLLGDGQCFAILEDWIVAAKAANSSGYELVQVFGTNLKKITDDILKDKPRLANSIQNGAIVNFFPSFIMEFRQGSSKFADEDMAIGLEQAFGGTWKYYVFLVPLIKLPFFMARYYSVLIKVFRRLFRSVLV